MHDSSENKCGCAAYDECSREVAVTAVGRLINDDKVHHISNVQANYVMASGGELQGTSAILKEDCHRTTAVHLLSPAQDSQHKDL